MHYYFIKDSIYCALLLISITLTIKKNAPPFDQFKAIRTLYSALSNSSGLTKRLVSKQMLNADHEVYTPQQRAQRLPMSCIKGQPLTDQHCPEVKLV